MDYDLIIAGGGPAGAAAAVYAARKRIKTAIIAESFGGQSIESNEIQNWIGTIAISGIDLANNLKKHVNFYAGSLVNIKEGEKIIKAEKIEKGFLVTTNKGEYRTKTILIATGSTRKKLEVPGAKEFDGRGITYCASCDGPFYADKDVVVIGGGNAGFEAASQLLAYCQNVTLISRDRFRADPVTVEKVLADPKMKAISHTIPIEIKGGKFVQSLICQKIDSTAEKFEIKADGIFVEIGHTPATDFIKDLVVLDEFRHIKIDHRNQQTSQFGIWAAGDCTDALYHQNNIAAGDAVKAIEDIYSELQKIK